MKPVRRSLVAALAAAPFAGVAGRVRAQDFPTKPVRILVGFAAGGVADITARAVAQKLSERLKQSFLVENRPSAGGILAAEAVAKAAPDGYTLLLNSNGNAVSVSLFKSLPYDPVADFEMVSTLGTFGLVVLASPESRIASVRDLIARAKAEPGKLNVGTIGIGSTQNLAAELFKSMAGIEATVVPFKGTPEVVTALRANDVQVGFEILAPVIGQLKGGALRPLAVTTARRFEGLPDVPTVAESGVPGYDVASWNGIAAPARTPPAVIERLNREIVAVLALPEIRERFLELGVVPRPSTPADHRALLVAEIAKWRDVIVRAKIEKQ
ncbi:MAG: tripartite tricarboxylate transporter substrate binding protein [Burkholderiales bacterium]|nr:tripartite tricarboxylate transporter substrate binding protein [Burkholderiales bacterium]